MRILLVFLVLGGAIFGLQTALAPGDIAEPLVDIAELGGAPLRSDPAPISDEATGETLDEPGASDSVVLEGGFLPDEIEDRLTLWASLDTVSPTRSFQTPQKL